MSKVVVESHIADVKAALADKMPIVLEALGLEAEGNAITEITEMGAVDTGRLRDSITHTHDENSAYIGTNVEYAQYVELGTSRMKARPFLRNAVTKYTKDYKDIIESALK